MKSLRDIAVETAAKLEPTLQKSIDRFADSKNQEIIIGRDALIRHRDRTIAIIETALEEVVAQKSE